MIDMLLGTLQANTNIKTATLYVSPKKTIRLTRIYKYAKRNKDSNYRLTIGAPNYLARQFIKLCIAAGEPFPIKKVQFKLWPVKRRPKK